MSQDSTIEVPRGLDQHRENLLNLLLRVFVIFALPPLTLGFIDTPQAMVIPAMLYAPCVVAAVFPHLDYRFRAWALILFVFFSAVSPMLNYGVFSPGRLVTTLVVLLCSLFLGVRAGFTALFVFLLSCAGVGYLIVNGHVEVAPEAQAISSEPMNWVWYGASFFTIAITVIFAIEYLTRSLTEQLAQLETEVNEKETARESERAALEQYRLLAENSRDVIWTMGLDGRITYVSPSIERMRGITPEQVLNGELPDSQAPSKQQRFLEMLWEELALEESGRADPDRYRVIETQIARADGSLFDAEIVSSFIRDEHGKPVGVMGVTRDITDRRTLEQQLHHSRRLESVGQLAGGVAHDFNNLLQAILGYADLAKSKIDIDSAISDDIDEIVRAGDRAKSLVRQLLAFSRRQLLMLREAHLGELINGVQKLLHRVIGEGVTIEFSPNHDTDLVNIDPGQIEQVLMNFCVNARDAMPEGGSITITTENIALDSGFCTKHVWARPGQYIRMSVADTGAGIDDQTIEHIFEPFFTSKEQGKGTGLGLSTVFGIVRQHNGLIDVESTVGEGTTFHVYLPLVEAGDAIDEDAGDDEPTGGTETILLADDDELVRRVVRIMLRRQGYTVHSVKDGKEAIAYYDTHADEIDMLLLDVVMPKAGGRVVAEHVEHAHPGIPILFLTGYEQRGNDEASDMAREIEILEKPFHNDDLLRTIRRVLDNAGTNPTSS